MVMMLAFIGGYPLKYLECLSLIKRKTDLNGDRNIIFTTSYGLLTINQILKHKIGGSPLFLIHERKN